MPIISDFKYFDTPVAPPHLAFRAYSTTKPPVEVINGDWNKLPGNVQQWAKEQIEMCKPMNLHIMDGSDAEDKSLKKMLTDAGVLIPLKYEDCWLARTDPRDVARVESKTVISTPEKIETIPPAKDGVKGQLGHWISPKDLDDKIHTLFPNCMNGRTMYMIPFSMGPVGGPLSKIGIELTDSAYVGINMRIMTRVGNKVIQCLKDQGEDPEFVKCLHSVGKPLKPGDKDVSWPCNPEKVMIAHKPHSAEIISFGSGYGGNSLLGKKCFSLRIGSTLAKREGWLAEHMLIMGIKTPYNKKREYIAAAFPSACGKTNLAMLQPTIPGYEVTCVGDDIAWLRFDKNGHLRAINPENGFFGVAPGTSYNSNPMAMDTIFKGTIFTNVGLTDDMGVWWEGMTKEKPAHLIDWHGKDWTPDCGRLSSHPNSRFCAPAVNCPALDPDWESPEGVKIEAFLFGGRRPEGVPLVYESYDFEHGVFMGASVRSEATAAAEHKAKVIMHDPFSMRPFFGYNFGDYLSHWLSLGRKYGKTVPKVFMVNWFRKNDQGQFIWPGFGENIRVLDWVLRRCKGEDCAVDTVAGRVPKPDALNTKGLDKDIDMKELLSTPSNFWLQEVDELKDYFDSQVGKSLPNEISHQLQNLEKRAKEANA